MITPLGITAIGWLNKLNISEACVLGQLADTGRRELVAAAERFYHRFEDFTSSIGTLPFYLKNAFDGSRCLPIQYLLNPINKAWEEGDGY